MTACLMIGATLLSLSGDAFTLEWEHSVERIAWQEAWQITSDGLKLTRAAVKGSGAGMEPGPGARLADGWWVWAPSLPLLPALTLAASGATRAGWRLCDGDDCRELGADPGDAITLAPCGD
ncbi:DUF1850 domain-containing protein [Pontitalea aquivivens]|uniref:DUF1850 domain-containing protein n=1 Tax=Pontitalea aquivivens TaxID=3388663 RepID=UPI003970A9C3